MNLAVRNGCDVTATVIGRSDFVPNYERLISESPIKQRITHLVSLPRSEVPAVMWEHDVMCQPSDEENFGSSVAEAMACGIPSIVGATNGTGDYLCQNSIRLADDRPATFARAIEQMSEAKKCGGLKDFYATRAIAVKHFDPASVADRFLDIARNVAFASKQANGA